MEHLDERIGPMLEQDGRHFNSARRAAAPRRALLASRSLARSSERASSQPARAACSRRRCAALCRAA